MTKPATIDLDRERAFNWLMKGAQPTDTARAILKFKGVMYRKHLMRGVKKGALTQEQADTKYQEWITSKEAKIAARVEQTQKEKEEFLAMVSGKPKAVAKAPETVVEGDAPQAPDTKSFAESVEQTTVESFTESEEAAPVVEEAPAAEEPKEEAPKAEEPVAETEAPKEETPAKEEAPAADDLTKIEGIGPKIAETFTAAGIATFAALAAADVEKLNSILADASLASHDPTTWPAQAKMAAAGEWDKLKTWQDELDGGKEVAKKEEE